MKNLGVGKEKEKLEEKISVLLETTKSNASLSFIVAKIQKLSSFKLKNKIVEIIHILIAQEIPFDLFSKYMFDGIPDDISSLRPLLWKISLNYLSLNPSEWDEILKNKRERYETYKKKFKESLSIFNYTKTKSFDDPLSLANDSKWKNYFDDLDLYESVNKDILRTKSNMNFVSMPYKSNNENLTSEVIVQAAIKLKNSIGIIQKMNNEKKFETNADVMNRILFIYSKLHPDVSYIQGMNDLLAPIFYCFSNDNNPLYTEHVEADSFITFENLMEIIKNIFIRKKDNEPGGINYRFNEIGKLLKMIDLDLFLHLNSNKVKMEFYAFRWITLFFTQDFEMPDILRLWDSILADPQIFEFLYMLILAVLIIKKDKLMQEDMSGIMMELQTLQGITIYDLIKNGLDVRERLNKCLEGEL